MTLVVSNISQLKQEQYSNWNDQIIPIPRGGWDGIKTGVHMNTKIYITDSTTVCNNPNSKIWKKKSVNGFI